MELSEQKKLCESAQTWFDGKFRTTILDNRRRFRMQLKDDEVRKKRKLSRLPSTKTPAAVDRYVERALIEYHQDPDAISYTSLEVFDPRKDEWARWLTSTVHYRMRNTFPFFSWNQASLMAGGVDGVECALVSWSREGYTEKAKEYSYTGEDGISQPVPKHVFDEYSSIFPGQFQELELTNFEKTKDTWWIDQLEPGKDVIWDPTAPYMNVNLGGFVKVVFKKSAEELKNLAESGILDKKLLNDDLIRKYQKTKTTPMTYSLRNEKLLDEPGDVDLGELGKINLTCFFFKENSRWMCQFSFDFVDELSGIKPVNEVWFGGRKVHILPVVVGHTKPKLWESGGRAVPEIIAPIEDEHIDHKNNVNDAAKIAIQGRWWVDEDSDVNIDRLLNARVVRGRKDEDFGALETNFDVITTLRADDARNMEINELIPAGVMSGQRNVVPKGTNKTLGAQQMGQMQSDEKMGVQLYTRNETFLKPILYLIAQLEMAFETDEVVLRVSANAAGIKPPEAMKSDGKTVLDISVLDFGIGIQINAGLGSAPRYQKADTTMQLVDWGKAHGVPVRADEAFKQLSTLAGYNPDQLIDVNFKPPPPQVEYKATVNIDLATLLQLEPEAGRFLLQKFVSGEMGISAKIDDNPQMNLARQNGGGFITPDRTGNVVDATGAAALGMSNGGIQNGES